MKITTVFLDAGGVILDESEHEEARAELAAEILRPIVSCYNTAQYWRDVEEAVELLIPSAYQYAFWKYLKGDRRLFDKLFESFKEEWENRRPPLKLNSGFEKEVKAISQNFKIGIAGQYGKDVLELLEKHSILDCFTYRFTQDDFSITKPDPRYYEQILKKCGVTPEECIMVGDRIDKDVIPAKQLGMKTILIRMGLYKNQQPRIPFEIPDAELDNIKGLSEAILKVAEK
jgi:HAD superfamily hydrolase (TIGR01549 family)